MPFPNEIIVAQTAATIASMAVGLVFGYAAVSKLLNIRSLVAGIRDYKVVPDRFALLAAGFLVVGEGYIALAHFGDIGLQFTVPGTIVLLSFFFVVAANLLRRGEKLPCFCFGAGRGDLVDIQTLFRIALLLLVELALYRYEKTNGGQMAVGTRGIYNNIDSLAVAVLIVTLVGWCLALVMLHRAWRVVRS